jgi:hypothetical protein
MESTLLLGSLGARRSGLVIRRVRADKFDELGLTIWRFRVVSRRVEPEITLRNCRCL